MGLLVQSGKFSVNIYVTRWLPSKLQQKALQMKKTRVIGSKGVNNIVRGKSRQYYILILHNVSKSNYHSIRALFN